MGILLSIKKSCNENTVKLEKVAYFKHIFHDNVDNKERWKKLKQYGVIKSKSANIPDNLNNPDHFLSSLGSNTPSLNELNQDALNNFYSENLINVNRFTFSKVNDNDITSCLAQIKNKAIGSDNIDLRMILFCTPLIVPLLTNIINCCIETSHFPQQWKVAKVIPVSKVANPVSYTAFRPIS